MPGDVLLGNEEGGLRLCPPSWLPSGRTQDELRDTLRPLLDLPVEMVLVSHGDPVVEGAQQRAEQRVGLGRVGYRAQCAGSRDRELDRLDILPRVTVQPLLDLLEQAGRVLLVADAGQVAEAGSTRTQRAAERN